MTSSRSQTTSEDKGVNYVAERGYPKRLQQNRHGKTQNNIKMKHCHCFPEQETLRALLSTGWFQERITA